MKNTHEKLSFFEKTAYGLGDFGCNLMYASTSSFLIFYYTDYAKVDPLKIGAIFLFSKILDILFTIFMGGLIDRTKSRFGKARPWLLWMAVPFAISVMLLFSVPSSWPELSKLIYIFITYNISMSFIYTAINVPYGTMNALITANQHDRALLNIFRMFLANAGGLLINMLTLPLIKFLGGDNKAWRYTFILYGVLSVIIFLASFLGTKERTAAPITTTETKLPFKTSLIYILKNKYWLIVTLSLFFIFVNYAFMSGSTVYYAKVILSNTDYVSYMSFISTVTLLVTLVLSPIAIKKLGKRNFLMISCVVYTLGSLAFLPISYGLTDHHLFFITFANIIKGVGNAGIAATIWAMIPDVIDYGAAKSGYRNEGLTNSACSVGYKLGNGLGAATLGTILSLGHYSDTAVVQKASALFAINSLFIYIPAITSLIVVVLIFFYHLEKEPEYLH